MTISPDLACYENARQDIYAQLLRSLQTVIDARSVPALNQMGIHQEKTVELLMAATPRVFNIIGTKPNAAMVLFKEELLQEVIQTAMEEAEHERLVNEFMALGATKQCMKHFFQMTTHRYAGLLRFYNVRDRGGPTPQMPHAKQQRVEHVVRVDGLPNAQQALNLAKELDVSMRVLWGELRGYVDAGRDGVIVPLGSNR